MNSPFAELPDNRHEQPKLEPNLRMRQAMVGLGMTYRELAELVGCNIKTAQRWCYEGRVPRSRRRERVAAVLRVPSAWLFPPAVSSQHGGGEVAEFYGGLDLLPSDVLNGLAAATEHPTSVASGNANFLNRLAIPALRRRDDRLVRILATNASRWTPDQAFQHVAWLRKSKTSGIGSMLWADDTILIMPSLLGDDGLDGPVMLVQRRRANELFDTLVDRFEQLWESAVTPRRRNRAGRSGSAVIG